MEEARPVRTVKYDSNGMFIGPMGSFRIERGKQVCPGYEISVDPDYDFNDMPIGSRIVCVPGGNNYLFDFRIVDKGRYYRQEIHFDGFVALVYDGKDGLVCISPHTPAYGYEGNAITVSEEIDGELEHTIRLLEGPELVKSYVDRLIVGQRASGWISIGTIMDLPVLQRVLTIIPSSTHVTDRIGQGILGYGRHISAGMYEELNAYYSFLQRILLAEYVNFLASRDRD